MSGTPDRTTVKLAIDALTTQLRDNLVAEPPTVTRPLRRVEVCHAGIEEFPRPFLTLLLTRTKPAGAIDNDKLVEVTMTLRLVTDVSASVPHEALLDRIGVIDDYFDSIIDIGVTEGAGGFDGRVWTFEYPRGAAGSRVAAATATETFVVKVEREQNRVPAN